MRNNDKITSYSKIILILILASTFIIFGILLSKKTISFFTTSHLLESPTIGFFIWGLKIILIFIGISVFKFRDSFEKRLTLTNIAKMKIYLISLFLLCFAAGETALRVKGFEPWEGPSEIKIEVQPGEQFFTHHPTLGYAHLPGEFNVILKKTSYSFKVTHLENTFRITQPLNRYESAAKKKEIWFFGGSFIYGWSVNDEESLPWLVQKELREYEVVNFGVNGYGIIHSLIQLQEALRRKVRPDVVILAYAAFYDERNIFSRARRKHLTSYEKLGPLIQPYAKLNDQGELMFHMASEVYQAFPLMRYSAFLHWLETRYNRSEGFFKKQSEVSRLLVREIHSVCQENNIKLFVVNIWPHGGNHMLEFCNRRGINMADISFPWEREMTNHPHDPHPGHLGHKKYAEALVPALKKILQE